MTAPRFKYSLDNTFNGVTISEHKTLAAAVKADMAYARAIRRANGSSSYIPTRIYLWNDAGEKWAPVDQESIDIEEGRQRGW